MIWGCQWDQVMKFVDEKEDEAGYIDLESGDRVHICLTDYTNNFVLLYTFRDNPKAPDGADTVYVPLFLNRENVETVSYFNDKAIYSFKD